MLAKGKHHVEHFCFHKSPQNNAYCHHFYFLTSASVRPKQPKSHSVLTLLSHSTTTLFGMRAATAGLFVFIVVWCIARQVVRNGEKVKHFHNCMKVLSQFVHQTVQICSSIVTGRNEAVHMIMHRYHSYNFRFQLLRQKIVSVYNVAAVCCMYVSSYIATFHRSIKRSHHRWFSHNQLAIVQQIGHISATA